MRNDKKSIVLEKVNKSFNLYYQKTLKELFDALLRRKKTIEKIHALKDISFSVKAGESVGIIGKNGAGKSTLLMLIAGVTSPTSGKVIVKGKVTPLIELGAGFHPELTGKENIFLNGVILGLDEKYLVEQFENIVAFSEIPMKFIFTPVKHYSSGMYMRLAFSVAVFTNPDILLIDEILAVGDSSFQKKCLDKMNEFKKKGVTTIFVSHDMGAVENFCERVLYLKQGELVFDGPAKEGVKLYLKE